MGAVNVRKNKQIASKGIYLLQITGAPPSNRHEKLQFKHLYINKVIVFCDFRIQNCVVRPEPCWIAPGKSGAVCLHSKMDKRPRRSTSNKKSVSRLSMSSSEKIHGSLGKLVAPKMSIEFNAKQITKCYFRASKLEK